MSKQAHRRCRNAPIPGGFVCRHHGGAAPQVQKSARERLAALAEGPAVEAMARALKSGDMGAVVRAARDLLDRCNLRDIELEREGPEAYEYLRWLPTPQLEQVAAWLKQAKAAMAAGAHPCEDEHHYRPDRAAPALLTPAAAPDEDEVTL